MLSFNMKSYFIYFCSMSLLLHSRTVVNMFVYRSRPHILTMIPICWQDSTLYSTRMRQSDIRLTSISKNLQLREIDPPILDLKSTEDQQTLSHKRKAPLVLLFAWLYPKEDALDKYCSLYHEKGQDVLVIKSTLQNFIRPAHGMRLAKQVLNYLDEHKFGIGGYVVHAFSIGAYLFTLCSYLDHHSKQQYGFRRHVVAAIFDSIVIGSLDNMSHGISRSLTSSKMAEKSMLTLVSLYANLTKPHTVDKYDLFVAFFKEQPILVPTLFFYSHDDPMCNVDSMTSVINMWKKRGDFVVSEKSWFKSVHAAHLRYHRDEYTEAWRTFLHAADRDRDS